MFVGEHVAHFTEPMIRFSEIPLPRFVPTDAARKVCIHLLTEIT